MQNCFLKVSLALKSKIPVVFVSVLAREGSTPGEENGHMIIYPDGSSIGTIGGGAVEFEVQCQASKLFTTKQSERKTYHLTPNEIQDLGMVCGGSLVVYLQYLDDENEQSRKVFQYLASESESGRDIWLIRNIDDCGVMDIGVWDKEDLLYSKQMQREEIESLLCEGVTVIQDEKQYIIERVSKAGVVYIFGGGHVAQALVPVLTPIGFPCVIYEDREEFADPKLFSSVKDTVLGSFQEIHSQIRVTKDDYVVVMTRGHQADFEVLLQMLATEAKYIGCIGSRTKVKTTFERLKNEGFSMEEIRRIYSPIGLEIGGQTPQEISISIAAQLIAHRSGKLKK